MDEIEIDIKRYEELLKKEYVYDLYRDKLLKDTYVFEPEKTLFEIPNKEK